MFATGGGSGGLISRSCPRDSIAQEIFSYMPAMVSIMAGFFLAWLHRANGPCIAERTTETRNQNRAQLALRWLLVRFKTESCSLGLY